MNAIPMSPVMMKAIPGPSERCGYIGIAYLFTDSSHHQYGEPPADTGTESVRSGFAHVQELPLLHEERTTHDGTVHGYQRQEDTERVIERRAEPLHNHLDELHE